MPVIPSPEGSACAKLKNKRRSDLKLHFELRAVSGKYNLMLAVQAKRLVSVLEVAGVGGKALGAQPGVENGSLSDQKEGRENDEYRGEQHQ